jgi:uncharacterized membrane protein
MVVSNPVTVKALPSVITLAGDLDTDLSAVLKGDPFESAIVLDGLFEDSDKDPVTVTVAEASEGIEAVKQGNQIVIRAEKTVNGVVRLLASDGHGAEKTVEIRVSVKSVADIVIPIVIGAAVYGAKAGAWLGLVFSITVLAAVVTGADTGGFLMWGINPFMTAAIVLGKGVAAGFLSGLVFRMLQHKNQMLATAVAAVVCHVVNTGLFLIGTLAVFEPLLTQWAQGWMEATGRTDASLGTYLIVGMVGLNFLVELGINMILSPVVVRILKIRKAA